MMKKGDLVKYKTDWDGVDHIGIVLETLDGFHIRKSWSESRTFIEKYMLRIYWLSEPSSRPVVASRQMMLENWPLGGTASVGLLENATNIVVDEWCKITEEDNWFFAEHFILVTQRDEE